MHTEEKYNKHDILSGTDPIVFTILFGHSVGLCSRLLDRDSSCGKVGCELACWCGEQALSEKPRDQVDDAGSGEQAGMCLHTQYTHIQGAQV